MSCAYCPVQRHRRNRDHLVSAVVTETFHEEPLLISVGERVEDEIHLVLVEWVGIVRISDTVDAVSATIVVEMDTPIFLVSQRVGLREADIRDDLAEPQLALPLNHDWSTAESAANWPAENGDHQQQFNQRVRTFRIVRQMLHKQLATPMVQDPDSKPQGASLRTYASFSSHVNLDLVKVCDFDLHITLDRSFESASTALVIFSMALTILSRC